MRSLVVLLCLSLPVGAQSGFGPQQVVSTNADGAASVYATDLDGDGDADVLSASHLGDKIAWYENIGGGSFGPQQVITTNADDARSVYATDLDGDGDADVLSASYFDNKVAWYENQLPPPCPSGTCLDLLGTPAIGSPLSLLLQSPSANAACYVLADPQTAMIPLLTVGGVDYFVHLALGVNTIPLADPSGTFGASLTNPATDANGHWSWTIPIPNDPILQGLTYYGEAFVFDGVFPLPPNGIFWQSNLLTVTIQ